MHLAKVVVVVAVSGLAAETTFFFGEKGAKRRLSQQGS
jgi:hypothetical protein